MVTESEGCLSVPGERAEVSRAGVATVTGSDLHGQPLTVTGTGVLARCLQHETDHLRGIGYVDLLPQQEREAILAAGLPGRHRRTQTPPAGEPNSRHLLSGNGVQRILLRPQKRRKCCRYPLRYHTYLWVVLPIPGSGFRL